MSKASPTICGSPPICVRREMRVEVYPEADKLGKQFKYASARGLKFVTVVGGDERAAGQVTVKNMESGEQTSIARAEAPAWLAAQIQQALSTANS